MYEDSLKTNKNAILTENLKFGAGPAPLPTPVLEKGAAVSIFGVHVSLDQIFSPEICNGNLYFVEMSKAWWTSLYE